MISGVVLLLVCRLLGLRVTSWYRTAAHNAEVGGVPNSYHLKAGAVDLGLESAEGKMDVLRALGYEVIKESDHYHVETSESLEAKVKTGVQLVFLARW